MVDYYALISPTIEPLADASPEERRVVYDRLVTMLDQQLRAADPPRTDKDILKERINLEAAIRRVERRILSNKKQNAAPNVDRITQAPSQPTIVETTPPLAEQTIEPIEPPIVEIPAKIEALPKAEWPLVDDKFHAPIVAPRTTEDGGIKIPQAPPLEPTEIEELPLPKEPSERPVFKLPHVEILDDEEPFDRAEQFDEQPEIESLTDESAVIVLDEPITTPIDRGTDIRPGVPSGLAAHRRGFGLSTEAKGVWLRVGIIALVILALTAAIGGVAEYLAQRSAERLASHIQTPQSDVSSTEQKLMDRLPIAPDEPSKAKATGSGLSQNTSDLNGDQDLMIQRAILLEEPPNGVGDPKRTMGKVSWKLETIRSALTTSSDIGARATIDLGDAGLTASVVFRRNRDQTSANTHLIEITTTPSADNPNGKVRDVSVPELRVDEKSRGATLSGIAVPVSDNVFLIGLNGLPADMQRNVELLRSRSWFLIPMRYANGKRALLLFEKGKPGERVFEDAMQTWQ